MNVRSLVASLAVASVVLMGAVGTGRAADQWFILGEQTIKSVDQGVMIKSEGSRWAKDVKQMRIGVEGADVEIKKVVLGWDNRPDDDDGYRSSESRRQDDSERCARTQGTAQVRDGRVQDCW